MKYKITVDSNNYLISLNHTGTSEDTYELSPVDMDLVHLNCYHLVDDVVLLDEGKRTLVIQDEENEIEIETLKKQLSDTDYLVSRTFEQVMALDNPLTFVSDLLKITKEFKEKYAETITNRETWRKRIEELENDTED